MNDIQRVLELAKAQVGIGETPPNSSNNKFNREYYGGPVNDPKLDWCVVFVWWVFRNTGLSNLFYGGGKTASCTTFTNYHQTQEVPFDEARAGDIVLFDWSGKQTVTNHIGIILEREGDTLHTVEGNTNDHGGGGVVALKTREHQWVSHIIRPMYEVAKTEENAYDPILHNMDDVPTWAAPAVKWGIQEGFINLAPDGTFNIYTSNLQVLTWIYRRENNG